MIWVHEKGAPAAPEHAKRICALQRVGLREPLRNQLQAYSGVGHSTAHDEFAFMFDRHLSHLPSCIVLTLVYNNIST